MVRFGWLFWLGLAVSMLIALRNWLPFAAQAHLTASSYGWMIICAGTALVFMGFGREKPVLKMHVTLLVLLVLLLALGLVAELFSGNLKNITSPADVDRIFRPFILVQLGMLLFVFLALPHWLDSILPEKAPKTAILMKPLTSRQEDVMRLLARGYSNSQIATALHITKETAKYHVSKLMVEQGKSSRHELGELAKQLMREHVIKNE